jgi:hypothetical protein
MRSPQAHRISRVALGGWISQRAAQSAPDDKLRVIHHSRGGLRLRLIRPTIGFSNSHACAISRRPWRPSCEHSFHPPLRGRAERRVPDTPLGLTPAVVGNSECVRTFGRPSKRRSARGVFRFASASPSERSDHPYLAQGEGPGEQKRPDRTPRMRSSVVRFRGSFHLKESRLFCPSGILTTEEPSCPQADVTQAPRDAASPASTASCPAVTTIALAPLMRQDGGDNNP